MAEPVLIGKRYEIQETIGRGAMGTVSAAFDHLEHKRVAIKRVTWQKHNFRATNIQNTYEANASLNQSLNREFQILSQLRHPNIISVLDYGFEKVQPYIVMELLENAEPITSFVQHSSLSEKTDLICQLLRALEYLHHHKVIHRDLKPHNILVVENQVKLLDFGIALNSGAQDTFAGTLAYMSPERLALQPASIRSDLYAVGIIFYEMLTGELPFLVNSRTTVQMVRHRIQRSINADALGPLKQFILQMTAEDPNDRPRSAYISILQLSAISPFPIDISNTLAEESQLEAAPMIGYDTEFDVFKTIFRRVIVGYGGVLIVKSDPGNGKSRFVRECANYALLCGATVLNDIEQSIICTSAFFSGIDSLTLVILEDIHNDMMIIDCLKNTLDSLLKVPILVMVTANVEPSNTNVIITGAEEIKLKGLNENGIRQLIDSIVGDWRGSDPDFITYLRQSTNGNIGLILERIKAIARSALTLYNVPIHTALHASIDRYMAQSSVPKKYLSFEPEAELIGIFVLPLVNNINYRGMNHLLATHNLVDVKPDRWYKVQNVLDMLSDVASGDNASDNMVIIGLAAASMSWENIPDSVRKLSLEDYLRLLCEHYHRARHRNYTGSFIFNKISDTHFMITTHTPYPDELLYGMIYGFLRNWVDHSMDFMLSYDAEILPRDRGGAITIFHINLVISDFRSLNQEKI